MTMQRKTILQKDFMILAIGQIISLFGNQILRYALPLYLLNQTRSSALFGTISAVAFIPMILLCPIGGIFADRVNKRNIMVILDFTAAGLTLLFYLLVGKVDIVPLMAAAMIILYGIQGAYQPAVQASVPALADSDHMMGANSIVNLISSLANMLGPVIGGILFSLFGLTPILYASAGFFCAAAMMELFLHIPYEKKERNSSILVVGMNDFKESFDYIFHKRPILWKISLIFASLNLFLTALIIIGVPVIVTQHLNFTSNTANRLYGYAQGIIAAGGLSGGLLAGILSKKLRAKASPFLIIGCALSILLGGFALQILKDPMQIYIVLVIGCGLFMVLATLFSIQMMTCLQMIAPPSLIGKVISCVMCLCMCSSPLGQLIYGVLFEKIGSGIYLPFYIAAIIMITISLVTRHVFYGADRLMEQKCRPRDEENEKYAVGNC